MTNTNVIGLSNGANTSKGAIINNVSTVGISTSYVRPTNTGMNKHVYAAALKGLYATKQLNLNVAIVTRWNADRFRDQCLNALKDSCCALTVGKVGNTDIPKLLQDDNMPLNVRVWLAKYLSTCGYPVTVNKRKITLPGEFDNIDLDKVKKGTKRIDSAVDLALKGDESKIKQFLFTKEKEEKPKGKPMALKDRLLKAVERYSNTGDYTTEQDKAVLNCISFIASNTHRIEEVCLVLQQIQKDDGNKTNLVESSVEKVEKADFSEKLNELEKTK